MPGNVHSGLEGCQRIVISGDGLGGSLFGVNDLRKDVGPNGNRAPLDVPFIPGRSVFPWIIILDRER
ncbi:hypothetical protein C8R44DRAFT_768683, partial [Mycena epipterygia]